VDALVVAIEEKVQVVPRGSNKKMLAFEELDNFLELDENHVVEEGDVEGLVSMEETNASKEEANQYVEKHPISDLPNFGNKEPKTSKRGKKVVKPMVECVFTTNIIMHAIRTT
jgi:hypothetical protein